MKAMPSATRCVPSAGKAEIRAATEAAMETATVRVYAASRDAPATRAGPSPRLSLATI
jgi:hypothetical protein